MRAVKTSEAGIMEPSFIRPKMARVYGFLNAPSLAALRIVGSMKYGLQATMVVRQTDYRIRSDNAVATAVVPWSRMRMSREARSFCSSR
jgi:Tfp pilus assembly protein PilP